MWVLRFQDGQRSILFLREYVLEGGVLMFEHEEQALRFCRQVAPLLSATLGVNLSVVKLSADPKKEKLLKVSPNKVDRYISAIALSLQ